VAGREDGANQRGDRQTGGIEGTQPLGDKGSSLENMPIWIDMATTVGA